MKTPAIALLLGAAVALAAPAAPAGAKSAATITGSFAESCRSFSAHSTKDISHVVVRYADGRVVKDETTTRPDYSIDGAAAIGSVDVKSGPTTQAFPCTRTGSPPTAMHEIKTPEGCFPFSGVLYCVPDQPRTVWTRPDSGQTQPHDPSVHCPPTFGFRGTSNRGRQPRLTARGAARRRRAASAPRPATAAS